MKNTRKRYKMRYIEKSWNMLPIKPERISFQAWRRKMKSRPSSSVLNYVLRVKKVEVATCEAISHALNFESEMNAWMSKLDEKRKEGEKNGEENHE